MKTLYLFLLMLFGVSHSDWDVKYPHKLICAVRGFSVSINCSYFYPQDHQVIQKLWCSMNSNKEQCVDPPYIYNSSLNTKSDFEFTGNDKSDCTLLIHNVQFNYSGVYKFRFITNVTDGKWTGEPGATLQVTDLKVSLIRLSGNGTLKQGDSLNLTCDVNCTHTSSQFVWSKNNQRLNTSGPVLHFPALTVRDSGDYTCTWGTGETSSPRSETISLQVEDEHPEHRSVRVIVLVIIGVIVFVSVVSGAVIHNRRRKFTAPEENVGENGEKTTKPQFSSQVSHVVEEEMLNEEDVTYSSVQLKTTKSSQLNRDPQPDEDVLDKGGVIYASVLKKPNKVTKRCDHTEQQKDDSVIYSSVKMT